MKIKGLFTKSQVLTIPNILTYCRLALIPVIVYLYVFAENYPFAIVAITLSSLTDIVDGFIARKFNMISDLGKIIDPIADKLTQGTIILCLTVQYEWMISLVVFFVIKDVLIGILGLLIIKKHDIVKHSEWFGKANTVVLYICMMLLLLFPSSIGQYANGIILVCAISMAIAFVLYIKHFASILIKNSKKG